ncbi:MAG: TolC family protein [Ferruginibacter sp.]
MTHRIKTKQLQAIFITLVGLLISPFLLLAQANPKDSLLAQVTLGNAIGYALVHQPVIRQSQIDQQVTEANIKRRLSAVYPQVNFNYSLQRNFIIQSAIIGGNVVKLGVNNTSAGQFTFTQAIFDPDILLANRTKKDVRLQAAQATSFNKIDLAAEVAKAFYDVLSTMQQIKIADENILRIERSLKDAFNQYKSGISDKIDYKRATITLNNSIAAKRSNEEFLKAKLEYLKSLMGYPVSGMLNIVHDTTQLETEILLDTLQLPDYTARIEYQQLETQKRLLQYNVKYFKWGYLPTISANGAYNVNYQNNNFGKIFGNNYPNSFAAITLGFPIFQGGKRKADIRIAELDLQRNELDIVNLQNSVNSGYSQALASYKSNLQNRLALKENLLLAKEVYDVIQLQYRSGIKTYLEVITSETDLRTSQINYFNSMYQLMASKIDVQKALGQINY